MGLPRASNSRVLLLVFGTYDPPHPVHPSEIEHPARSERARRDSVASGPQKNQLIRKIFHFRIKIIVMWRILMIKVRPAVIEHLARSEREFDTIIWLACPESRLPVTGAEGIKRQQ
jgi:hypothetical protein